MMKKILKKILITAFVVVNIFTVAIAPVSAGFFSNILGGVTDFVGIDVPDVSEEIKKVENRYNISPNSVRSFTEEFNVSGRKNLLPTVRIMFSPQDPKPGQKITAKAFAQFFKNPKEELYFTWYLKRGKCAAGESDGAYDVVGGDGGEDGFIRRVSCDRDNDGELTVNDYKIEAARVLAGGGYYPDIGAPIQTDPGSDDDKDGYIARYGGDSKSNVRVGGVDPYYYYLNDYATGEQFEIVKEVSSDVMFPNCQGGGTPVCVRDKEIKCAALLKAEADSDSDSDSSASDSSAAANAQANANTAIDSNNEYTIPFCLPYSTPRCDRRSEAGVPLLNEGEGDVVCPVDTVAWCVTDPTAFKDPIIAAGGDKPDYTEIPRPMHVFNNFTCNDFDLAGEDGPIYIRNADPKETYEDANQGRFACANNDKEIPVELLTTCMVGAINVIEDRYRFHLFPRNIADVRDGDSVQVGENDGLFTTADEEFYGTDANDADTSDNRVNDEATVVGLGQDEFSWLYSPGDEIGVIVEGHSMLATKHENASNKIMFAMINNVCDYSDLINKGFIVETGEYTAYAAGRDVKIPSVGVDIEGERGPMENVINSCLSMIEEDFPAGLDNGIRAGLLTAFVDPVKGGAAKQLNVSLTYTPDNPINDPRDEAADGKTYLNMGDFITVDSAINDAAYDNNRLNFKWSVYRSMDGSMDFDPINWEPIPRDKFKEVTPWEGNDLGSFEFRMDLKREDLFTGNVPENQNYTYIKVRLEVQEDFDLRAQEIYKYDINKGRADVIIRVSEASNILRAYNVQTAEDTTSATAAEICGAGGATVNTAQIINCPVVRNQIIKLALDDVDVDNNKVAAGLADTKYTNFAWKLNGRPLYCPTSLSGCNGGNKMGAYNYLAVTGEVGTEYEVSVTANNARTGDTVEVSRKFHVVEPYIAFCRSSDVMEELKGSGDPAGIGNCAGISRKKIGDYISDQGGASIAQYSDNVFYAAAAAGTSSFTAGGRIRPEWAEGTSQINWFVDDLFIKGGDVVDAANQTVVSGDVPSKPGEVSTVTARVVFNQTPYVRDLLRKIWKVTDKELLQKQYESSMQVHFTDDASKIVMAPTKQLTPPQAFMASLGVNAPGVVIFIFRVLLAVGVIVFAIGLIWKFLPQQSRKL